MAERTILTIRDDRAPEMRVTLPAQPCGIEISPGARSETAPHSTPIRAHQPRRRMARAHPVLAVLRQMMEESE
jgi:hypothetical protein